MRWLFERNVLENEFRAAQKAVIDAGARWTIGREKLNSRAIIS